MNYIITRNITFFTKILSDQILSGQVGFCSLEDMILPEKIAVDSETTGLEARHCNMFCFQIGTGKDNYIVDFYTSGENSYKFDDVVPYIDDKILVGHNLTFDLGFMYKYNFWPKRVFDTMLASKILYNGDPRIRHDFGAVMKKELNVIYDKTDQKNIHLVKLSQPSTIEYSFNDVDKLLELEENMFVKLENGGFTPTYLLHCRYIKALAYMEQCGMPLSAEKWRDKMDQDEKDTAFWKKTIEDYIYDNIPKFADNQLDMFEENQKKITISVNSPLQMLKVFNYFGIPTKDKDGKDSINDNVISKSKHEFVDMWLKYQKANHRVTTFGEKIYSQIEDGRIYTNFNPAVDTARLSTRRGGINFLNFPSDKPTRYCFKVKEGNKMIVCDYTGQETVIVADLSGDEAMTKSVVEGADLHSLLARVLFPELEELSDEDIATNHADKRKAAKAPRFAMSYGGNAFTIHMNEGIPLERAQEIEAGFKNLHAGLYAWGDDVFKRAISVGYIESVDGWKLKLPFYDEFKEMKTKVDSMSQEDWTKYKIGKLDYKKKFEEEEAKRVYKYQFPEEVEFYKEKKGAISKYFKLRSEYFRLCLNNPVQTRGAHQIKLATCLLFEWIVENNLQWIVLICNSVHDELVAEASEEYAEVTKHAVESSMLEAGNHYLTNLRIKADANIGASWGEAK